MAKCSRDTHPQLFAYLEAYGLDDNIIARIDRIKGNASSGYYLVGFPRTSGDVGLLDLSHTPDRCGTDYRDGSPMEVHGWNMLNDGMDDISEKDWNRVRIAPYCETFTIPGHPVFGE